MKERAKKFLALGLSVAMILSLAACGQESKDDTKASDSQESSVESSKSESAEESAEESKTFDEIVELTCFPQRQAGGSNAKWFNEYLGEKIGVNVDFKITDGSTDVLGAYMASGELPDLIQFAFPADFQTAIDGGLLLNLDEYLDQLPAVTSGEMADYYDVALEYNRATYGDGVLYGLPIGVGGNTKGEGYNIRWDLYYELGMPEIKNDDDFLNVLKQMQDLAGTVTLENGEELPVYALGMCSDLDGQYQYSVFSDYVGAQGYMTLYISQLVMHRLDMEGEIQSVFDDDGIYKQALKYFFKANQMGILDPESPTTTFNDYFQKVKNGQILTGYTYWGGNYQKEGEATGTRVVIPDTWNIGGGAASDTGIGSMWAISADCENVEAALAFLNWMYSYEGHDVLMNGFEGQHWTYVDGSDSEKLLSSAYYDETTEDSYWEIGSGGTLDDIMGLFNTWPVQMNTTHEATGTKLRLRSDSNVIANSKIAAGKEAYSALEKQYIEEYLDGEYNTLFEKFEAEDPDRIVEFCPALFYVPAASDEIAAMSVSIGDVLVTAGWQMIYAEDEAEFEEIWDQAQADAEALGMDEVYADALDRWEQAKEIARSYGIDI